MYDKKRVDMSGIYKYFYETKLLSLLYFRAIHDDTIREFRLATNVDNVGAFGNIYFKATVRGHKKPVAVFIQAQHTTVKTLRIDYAKCFNSYLTIRRCFNKYDLEIFDPLYCGTSDETEFLFVIFTNADFNTQHLYHPTDTTEKLNELLNAGGTVNQVDHDVNNIEYLKKVAMKYRIILLAQWIVRFIKDDRKFQMMLTNEHILRYHVILAQKVVDVSDIQSEDHPDHRIASFRQDFFDNTEEYIMLFRNTLYLEIVKLRGIKSIEIFRSTCQLIDNDNDINLSNTPAAAAAGAVAAAAAASVAVNKAVEQAAIKILSALKFKVPIAFGNKDVIIRGNEKRIDKRIEYLTYKINNLVAECKPSKVVTIDESFGVGPLSLNGGIASAIGNIFVLDDNTKLMKITENCETLEPNAKRLYTKMNSEIQNLQEYKFDIIVNKFPKLSFDSENYDEILAKDFLSNLLIYSRQGKQRDLKEILKHEIEEIQSNQFNSPSFQVQTDAIFSRYYDEIQQWYMLPRVSPYLTQRRNVFRESIDSIIMDPLISSINFMYCKSKIQQHDYTFTEDAVRSLNLPDQPSSTIIVAENCVLTVIKLLQHLNDKQEQHFVLDLEYIASLSTHDLNALGKELQHFTNKLYIKKNLILVCDGMKSTADINTLEKIAKMIDVITVIIITNQNSFEILRNFFPRAENILHDNKCNLIDMCEESQKSIFETASAAFPGVEIRLDHLLRGWPKTDLKSADAAAVADKGTATSSRGVEEKESVAPCTSQDPRQRRQSRSYTPSVAKSTPSPPQQQ